MKIGISIEIPIFMKIDPKPKDYSQGDLLSFMADIDPIRPDAKHMSIGIDLG